MNEQKKPEILNQIFIGGEAFRKRISSRMKFLETRGSRIANTSCKRNFILKEQDRIRAYLITQKVLEYYELPSIDLIRELCTHENQLCAYWPFF